VSINGGYDYSRPNQLIFPRAAEWKNTWDLSVNASWSLWDGGRVKAEVAQASANRQVLQEGLREWDRALETEVVQRRLQIQSALAAVAYADDSVRSSTEARRVVGERYSVGTAPNVDVIDAQVMLLQAELDRTRAIANAHVAAARLDRALGR
jgi:outer membrane protein TolC